MNTQEQTIAIMESAGELFLAGRGLYEKLVLLGYDVNDPEIDAWLQAQENYREALQEVRP